MDLIQQVKSEIQAATSRVDFEDEMIWIILVEQRSCERLFSSDEFASFLLENEPKQESFFLSISEECAQRGINLCQYVERDGMWHLTEEIMVPGRIEPYYLLGFWDGKNWKAWSSPSSSEVGIRLDVCINFLRK